MDKINLEDIRKYVNENIVDFHERRIKSLEEMEIKTLIKKNPYLFKAKNIQTAGELISSLLEAFLSSSEEKLFGDFLEHLAIHVATLTCNGHKSGASGIDLEFINKGIHYVVSVKSGTNWGNSGQQDKLEENLRDAVVRIKQLKKGTNVQPVLGICYGKTKTSYVRGYLKVVGQNFWYLISENKKLYTDIIEPIGYRAKIHNDNFIKEKSRVINKFTKLFINDYCTKQGDIDWVKLVTFNSGNYDLDKFI
jgi:hypothetical protein